MSDTDIHPTSYPVIGWSPADVPVENPYDDGYWTAHYGLPQSLAPRDDTRAKWLEGYADRIQERIIEVRA